MPSVVDQALHACIKKHIDADKQVIAQALDSQKILRERLQTKCEEDATLPKPFTDGFLYGSLIRGTKKHPMDDVDFMFPLDGTGLSAVRGGYRIGKAEGEMISANPLLDPKYKDEAGLISSAKVMAALRAALVDSHPRSEVTKDGQAINVWLDAYGFGIDVVPSFYITPYDGSPTHIYIPFGQGTGRWLSTNPQTDLNAYTLADARLDGLLRPTAKLVKTWNENDNASRLGNFHLDLLALKAFPIGTTVGSLSGMLAHFFAVVGNMIELPCPQLTGFEPNVDHALSADDRTASAAKARQAARKAAEAIHYELRGETRKALECWSALLGEPVVVPMAA